MTALETDGYFFCLEDRTLLCRKCDVAIHTVNHHVSSHLRFLLTGVKVGLEPMKSLPCEEIPEATESLCLPSTVPKSTNTQSHKVLHDDFSSSKFSYGGGSSTEGIQQWQFDGFFCSTELNPMYNYTDNDSSKDLKDLDRHLTPIQCVNIARHSNRPTSLDDVFNITEKVRTIEGKKMMFAGHQKGRNTKENIQRNFGMPTPHGHQKALHMLYFAYHQGFPIVIFIDTPVAFADLKSEELGQGREDL
ncbi:hypothetical protein L2E82_19117 [Cichorium intybus]|uniref:Uncharacterized protein n=1 Tax=Cichorium intybus TaxID=13427 RepID=A0ACB9FBS7_CICIN|nr:hypothetical protein L2E82_19117 [Cichorium intybus]